MSTDVINFECELTVDDVLAWNYYHVSHAPGWKRQLRISRMYLLVSAFIIVMGILILWLSSFVEQLQAIFGVIFVFVGLGSFLYYALYPRRLRSSINKSVNKMYTQGANGVVGLHKFTISPEGVQDVSALDDTTIKWKAIENVIQTDEHLFILVRPNVAFIIPRRAFSDVSAFDKITKDVKAMLQASQTQQA